MVRVSKIYAYVLLKFLIQQLASSIQVGTATVVPFPNMLPFRILNWNNIIDGREQTLWLLLGEFKSPLPF
jgi:hypothetical protein